MLGKLVKYDIKSLIRVFIPIWIVAPIVAVMLSGAIHLISVSDGPLMNLFSEYVGPILLGILTILFVAVIVGMMIMTLILVIRRFWNGSSERRRLSGIYPSGGSMAAHAIQGDRGGHCKSDQWSDCGTFLPDPVPWHLHEIFTVWVIRSA